MFNESPEVSVRPAEAGEAAVITSQRRAMFAEMRGWPDERLDAMAAAFEPWVAERLARRLPQQAIDWCKRNRVRMVILHASQMGRPIYAALGFAPTNEMSVLLDVDAATGSEGDTHAAPGS